MNIILTALMGFFYRFFRNHQREIEVLMLRVIEAIAEDVIRRKKQKAKANDDSFEDAFNEDIELDQQPLG